MLFIYEENVIINVGCHWRVEIAKYILQILMHEALCHDNIIDHPAQWGYLLEFIKWGLADSQVVQAYLRMLL